MPKTKVWGVWLWLGITEAELAEKPVGVCMKCGKDATSTIGRLCLGHRNAYRRWRNKMEKKTNDEEKCKCVYPAPHYKYQKLCVKCQKMIE